MQFVHSPIWQRGSRCDVSDLDGHVVLYTYETPLSTSERPMFRYISRLPVSEIISELTILHYMRSCFYSSLLH
jgi:hypothetical protein